jgi:ribosome-associated protein
MHARQDLGEQLVRLGADALRRLALPELLRDAIGEAQRIKGHEALRRQMQYIGRLMRDNDYDAIHAAYDDLMGGSRESIALMHRCERLRDQLIEDDAALRGFLEQHPGVDTQWLRAKLRATRLERAAAKPPRHARELYQWLHQLLKAGAAGQANSALVAEPADGPPAAPARARP